MVELSKPLADKLYKKGFTPAEIPHLLDDLSYLIQERKAYTSKYITQEPENLGWGIQVIDESLLRKILKLLISVDEVFKQN